MDFSGDYGGEPVRPSLNWCVDVGAPYRNLMESPPLIVSAEDGLWGIRKLRKQGKRSGEYLSLVLSLNMGDVPASFKSAAVHCFLAPIFLSLVLR